MGSKIMWDILLFGDYKTSESLLHDLYVKQKMSLENIAEMLGVDKTVVRRELVELNFPIRPKGRPVFPENMLKLAIPATSLVTFATCTVTRKAIRY